MNDKKHIDRLFQEKLKNFEATPDDALWDNIHDRLHKDKRKRSVVPIWWKLAGVAALLVLLFTVGIKLTSNGINSDITKPVVDAEKQSLDSSHSSNKPVSKNQSQSDSKYSDEIQNQIENSSSVITEKSSNYKNDFSTNSNETVKDKSDKNQINQSTTTGSESNKNRLVNDDKSNSEKTGFPDKLNKSRILNSAYKEHNHTKDEIETVSKNNNNNSNQNNLDKKPEKSEIDKLIKDSKNSQESKVTIASEKIKNIISEEKKEENSIEDAIAEANTEVEKEKEKKKNRWNISPNVAPVYFNSLGKGSSLDAQFVDNDKSAEVTMSYGVGGSYAVNERLKVRAGINKVDMGYNTNNVIAFRSFDSTSSANSRIGNVSMDTDVENMTYLSTESLNSSITPEIINSKSDGSLNQRFGFIEVPLEVEYALINKKLAVNVIGGFSTLIVNNNEIFSKVDGTETRIGEANNINNMSYSANFGLGLNYHISEKVKVNVEPTFKYQINTFNNSSGAFQPYFIGIYTGLSYKF